MLPSQVRPLVQWKTALAGRAYRGRMFGFTPDTANQNANEHPTVFNSASWDALAARFVTGFVELGTTWTLVLWHRLRPPKPFIPPTPVVVGDATKRWATQRRSGDYGRLNPNPW